jgi:hypothetical protein
VTALAARRQRPTGASRQRSTLKHGSTRRGAWTPGQGAHELGPHARHGAPDRNTQKMPLRMRRSLTRGTPRGLFGSIGLMAVHSSESSGRVIRPFRSERAKSARALSFDEVDPIWSRCARKRSHYAHFEFCRVWPRRRSIGRPCSTATSSIRQFSRAQPHSIRRPRHCGIRVCDTIRLVVRNLFVTLAVAFCPTEGDSQWARPVEAS